MSKTKILIAAVLTLVISTACLSFGGLAEGIMDKALEEADLPEGALETAEAGFGAVATQAVEAAEGAMEDAQEGDIDDIMGEAIEEMMDSAAGGDVLPNPEDIPYPLPEDAQVLSFIDGGVVFQTGLTVEETVNFYRQQLGANGYSERTINTVVEDMFASVVFDGDPSGIELVVQATGMGDFTVVNVRLEDI